MNLWDLDLNKKIIVFGTGLLAAKSVFEVFEVLREEKKGEVSYFCDSSPEKWETGFFGYPVYPPDKLREEEPENIAVFVASESEGIMSFLKDELGINNVATANFYRKWQGKIRNGADRYSYLIQQPRQLNEVFGMLCDQKSREVMRAVVSRYGTARFSYNYIDEPNQYFTDLFAGDLNDNEVFVNVGSLRGGSTYEFIKFTNSKYKKVYAFEPDSISFATSLRNAELWGKDKIEVFNMGCSSYNGQASFSAVGNGTSSIRQDGDSIIQVAKLDDVINDEVTFIKMDIEGSEFDALLGAKRLIQTYKPKLAICVYHRHSDLIELPLLIKSMVPEYKLYLRHHNFMMNETTLYAKI